MPASSTVVIALKYASGVLIGADSQVSDPVVGVRWPMQKVVQIGNHPLVFGFSGSAGTAHRASEALAAAGLSKNTFEKRARFQSRLDAVLLPEYQSAARRNNPPPTHPGSVALHAISACWVEGEPGILEHEPSGDSFWHSSFHAVGSGGSTAYTVFRALGGTALAGLQERTALMAAVRILHTAVAVDWMGVSEPLSLFRINAGGVRQLGSTEIETLLQAVAEWEEDDRRRLFESDALGA